jgi:hypothetical protein
MAKAVIVLIVCSLACTLVVCGCGGGSDGGGAVAVSTGSGGNDAGDSGVSSAQVCERLGDMDGDGEPTVGDAIRILRIVVGFDVDDVCADANQNGSADVGDAIMVLRCIVGLSPWPISGERVLSAIEMVPDFSELNVGESVVISATGRDQFGATIDFAPTWTVEGDIGTIVPAVAPAAVSASYRFTATAAGNGIVRATCGLIVGETAIRVNAAGGDLTNLFFLHHSTGDGFVVGGDMRGYIANYNTTNGTSYELWDHGYNGDGLRNAEGVVTGTSYNIPDDNTDPDGLHTLWITDNGARQQIMANHQVIAFKSCFPASAISDAWMLNEYKRYYREMRDYFDAHPERLFVVMSTPPLHRLSTNTTEADNARRFAEWLKSGDYLSGHPNVVCFDVFTVLARADDGSATRNMLKYEYEMSHADGDSHPNAAANQVVGPLFAQFLIDAAEGYSP